MDPNLRTTSSRGHADALVQRGRADGFTLIELGVVVFLAVVIAAGLGSVFVSSIALFSETLEEARLQEIGRRVLERLGQELRSAQADTLEPLLMTDSDYVAFQKITGYTSGAVVLGPKTTLSLVLAPGETANGLDDNGDGRADEGVVRYQEDGQSALTIATDVTRLRLNRTTGGVNCTVEVAAVDSDGALQTRSFTEEFTLRN